MTRSCYVLVLSLAILSSALPGKPANAAFPYKFTISGPGLGRSIIEVWMSDDDHWQWITQHGLTSELPGQAPSATQAIYHIDWWWGPCWRSSVPCRSDPDGAMPSHTLYYFDALGQKSYLFYVSKPGYLPFTLTKNWIQMPPDFTQAIQQIITKRTVVIF